MDLCFTCVSLQSYSPTSSKPGNWMFVVEFIPLGSCSCHTTTAILIAPLRLTFSVSDFSRAVPYLSLCFSVRFTSPAQISYLVAYHSYVSTGHQVIITFHLSDWQRSKALTAILARVWEERFLHTASVTEIRIASMKSSLVISSNYTYIHHLN